jgi:hypothetical protein
MANNPFLKPTSSYKRQIDPIAQYVEQMAHYLATMTGDPIELCKTRTLEILKQQPPDKVIDPTVRHYARGDNGDTEVIETRLSQYIRHTVQSGDILTPSFTTYLHPSKKRSVYTSFVEKNKKLRSAAKKKSHQAKAEGNLAEHTYQENVQSKKKIYNNALSGAFGTEGTILHNPTAHSTLTSITRTVVSLCNATNERMLAGNRHYWSPDTVMNNLISTTTHTDYPALQAVMDKYGLVYPSVAFTLSVIQYSTDLYWKDAQYFQQIADYVSKLTAIQRAAFVYTGDFYHLRVFNPEVVKELLLKLSTRVVSTDPDPKSKIADFNEDILLLAHQVCSDLIKGMGKNYDKMHEAGVLTTIVGTAEHIHAVVAEYKDLLEALFLTENIPASIAQIPHMLRRVVPLSDTDSSCFAVDKWVEWYQGHLVIDANALAVGSAVAYLTTQTMAHILAIFSANINTPEEYMHTLAVKGEFIWDAFLLTNVAKHYAARTIYQEGNVFAVPEYEKKGVHLISSASPLRLIKDLHGMMYGILDAAASGQKISIRKTLTRIADMERFITQSLLNGEEEFYRSMMIKDSAGYTLPPTQSPYQHYLLWNFVFEPKYGPIAAPPYASIKIPTTLENKTDIKRWLETMEDKDFAQRMRDWIAKHNKGAIGMFLLPLDYIQTHGLPVEIKSILDTKRVVLELTNGYRLVLESLGFYCKKGWTLSELGY